MSQENLQLFRGGLAAWNAGDYEAIVDLCHPDVEWTFSDRLPDATGHIRGRGEVRKFFQNFTGDWSQIRIRADRVVDAGDHVVANVEFLARGRDGIEVSMCFVHVWTVRDGRIVRFRGFQSFDEALEAVGARDQPAGPV
jgi:ketosteroid isomerase-like protein